MVDTKGPGGVCPVFLMTGEIKHLANNERYRILIIDGETYIMDIENSFWKIIFPFLFWLLPNRVFKVEDQALVEQLQTEKMERKGVSSMTAIAGISYAVGISLAPLMDYFNVPMPPLANMALMLFAIMLVGLWYYKLSCNRKQKLYDVIELEKMSKKKLWIQPSSIRHFLNVLFSYIFLLGFDLSMFVVYIAFKNVMILIIASGFLLGFLMVNRKTIREGNATMKVKE
ncbi:DUF443 family protein [Lentibacillus daqui]|uniref:DUF443 family protein n=1 Tax=Lentibacillus daqui TaxID=2911514 RepID=UPI0022B1D361|nr:DUF443 family protein [Lentibacillus daqui]